MQDKVDPGNKVLQVNIRPVGKNADAIVQGRDHKNNRPESSVEAGMINFFWEY